MKVTKLQLKRVVNEVVFAKQPQYLTDHPAARRFKTEVYTTYDALFEAGFTHEDILEEMNDIIQRALSR